MREYPSFDRPSFLKGAAWMIDVFGRLPLMRLYPDRTYSAKALHDDWRAVGEDLFTSIRSDTPPEDRQLKLFH
jgi:hypothetical protein